MCRHLGYLGPPVALDELLLRPRHSLLEQAWAPCDMRGGGTINVDGFGVGWHSTRTGASARYRAAVPMWTDTEFAALAPEVTSTAVLGAVRSAMPGTPVVHTACAPFTDGTWLFSHNGVVSGWPESMAELAAKLAPLDLLRMDAPVDSALVWALLRQRLHIGGNPADAVRDTLHEVVSAAPGSRMNLLLTDGHVLVATTWSHSLHVHRGVDSVTVASEPFGESGRGGDTAVHPAWQEVPEGHLLVADTTTTELTPLPEIG